MQPRGCFNEYRAARSASAALVGMRAAPSAGDGVDSPPCPDGETGWPRLGVALPGPSDKEPALLPEIQPYFVNRIPLLLPPVAGPETGARDAPGEGCAWGRRYETVTALDRDRDRLRRAGPDPAPHTALAAILPSAANFARQLRAVPAVLILE